MNIVTGKRGYAHITSQQDRDKNMGIFGEGSCVLEVGHQLAAEITGPNEVTISDGVLSHQGCIAEIAPGTTEAVQIANGSVGMQRIDAIVARYTKNGSGIEDMQVLVLQGTPDETEAWPPDIVEGNIASGDTMVDMLLFLVYLNGTSLDNVVPQFSMAPSAANIKEEVDIEIGDRITDTFKIKTYTTGEKTVAANAAAGITGPEFNFSPIPGYTPLALISAIPSTNSVALRQFGVQNPVHFDGGNWIVIRNLTGNAVKTTVSAAILFVKDEYYGGMF